MTNRTHIIVCVCLLVVMGVLGYIMQSKFPARIDLPFDVQSTILAAEFASAPEEINEVLTSDRHFAKPLEEAQYIDFAFIPCYVALFVIVALALRRYEVPAARLLSWIAIGAAIAAGACDIAENMTIIKTARTPVFVSNVRMFSMPKWALVFLVMTIESIVFFFWPRLTLWWRIAAVVVGGLFLFTGASGLLFSALMSISDLAWSAGWITWATSAMLLFLLAVLAKTALAARGARAR